MSKEEILKAREALATVYDAVPVGMRNDNRNPVVVAYLALGVFIDGVDKLSEG